MHYLLVNREGEVLTEFETLAEAAQQPGLLERVRQARGRLKVVRIDEYSGSLVSATSFVTTLGGVGYAAATIGTSDIKNGAVTNTKIKNRTIRNLDVRRQTLTGSRIRETTLGTVPRSDGLAKHGVINSNGSQARGRGITSSSRLSTGLYQVVFNREVSDCSYLVTVGDASGNNVPANQGIASVSTDPANGNAVRVRTRSATGANPIADRSFQIAISCGT